MHFSVMKDECIENLNIKSDGIYVDGTIGLAGHSSEILKKIPEGFLYGFAASAVNIPMNLFQGAVGIILGVTLVKIIKMTKITF